MANSFDGFKGVRDGKASVAEDELAQLDSAMTLKPEPDSYETAMFAKYRHAFVVAMYGRLLQRAENIFFSPFGLWVTLGMPHAEARSETAVQRGRVLDAAHPSQTARVRPGPSVPLCDSRPRQWCNRVSWTSD